jgi:hypothetical protein
MDPRPFRSPVCKLIVYGAPGEIRTPDLLIRIRLLGILQDVARCSVTLFKLIQYKTYIEYSFCIVSHLIALNSNLNSHQNSHLERHKEALVGIAALSLVRFIRSGWLGRELEVCPVHRNAFTAPLDAFGVTCHLLCLQFEIARAVRVSPGLGRAEAERVGPGV